MVTGNDGPFVEVGAHHQRKRGSHMHHLYESYTRRGREREKETERDRERQRQKEKERDRDRERGRKGGRERERGHGADNAIIT